MSEVERQVTKLSNSPSTENDDQFLLVMGPFCKSAREQYELLQSMFTKMEQCYKDIATFFCLDPVKTPMDEFFGIIQKFVLEFRKAYDDNLRAKEMVQKARMAQVAHERALKDKENNKHIQKRYAAELSGGKPSISILIKTAVYSVFSFQFQRKIKKVSWIIYWKL